MTGYGATERESTAGVVRVELRSVNHRYFRTNLRLAPALEPVDGKITERLRERLNRGHINGSVRLDTPGAGEEGGPPLRLNEVRARQYVEAFRTLKERLGVSGEVDVNMISRFGDVIEPEPTESAEAG